MYANYLKTKFQLQCPTYSVAFRLKEYVAPPIRNESEKTIEQLSLEFATYNQPVFVT